MYEPAEFIPFRNVNRQDAHAFDSLCPCHYCGFKADGMRYAREADADYSPGYYMADPFAYVVAYDYDDSPCACCEDDDSDDFEPVVIEAEPRERIRAIRVGTVGRYNTASQRRTLKRLAARAFRRANGTVRRFSGFGD